MYTSFHIKNFRCFEDLQFNDLARINLIGGRNNVGKTSVLEAIFLMGNPFNPDLVFRINAMRGLNRVEYDDTPQEQSPWSPVFNNFDVQNPIVLANNVENATQQRILQINQGNQSEYIAHIESISESTATDYLDTSMYLPTLNYLYTNGKDEAQKHYLAVGRNGTLKVTPPPPPLEFRTILLPSLINPSIMLEDTKRFSEMAAIGNDHVLLKALQVLEPRLTEVSLLHFNGQLFIHGNLGLRQKIPITLMGEGILRLTRIIVSMSYAQNGVALIDEIENGLHYATLVEVWKIIAFAAQEFNVQIFATTHSFEMIQAAREAFQNSSDDAFRYHRLDRSQKTGKISVKTYQPDILETAFDMRLEVR